MSRILEELHAHLRANKHLLLHYNAVTRSLEPYCWPLDEQSRPVETSKLADYRSSHVFSYPGCLCAAISLSTKQTESIFFDVFSGKGSGKEYFASCAKGVCGYAVKVFFHPRHPVLQFPRKAQPLNQHVPQNLVPCGLEVLADVASQHESLASRAPRGEKAEYSCLLDVIPSFPPPPNAPNLPSPGSMIYRLHSAHRPGLTHEEFRTTFVCCEVCEIVSTRRKYEHHQCANERRAVREDIPTTSDTEVLNLLYRLDMTGPELTLDAFKQIMARCSCGLVTTKLRFPIHECYRRD